MSQDHAWPQDALVVVDKLEGCESALLDTDYLVSRVGAAKHMAMGWPSLPRSGSEGSRPGPRLRGGPGEFPEGRRAESLPPRAHGRLCQHTLRPGIAGSKWRGETGAMGMGRWMVGGEHGLRPDGALLPGQALLQGGPVQPANLLRSRSAHSAHPSRSQSWRRWAGNYFGLRNEHEKAIEYHQRAVRLDPSNTSAYILMGHEFMELKNTPAATLAYRQALRSPSFTLTPDVANQRGA